MNRRVVWGLLALCVLAALALRVIPAYHVVFTPLGVNFQENDAWYHMRTVHNLLAHFPFRSGFDPYAIYPAGENVPTGPLFDYVLGGTAWVLGAGSPSYEFVDRVGAWIPALLGASFPLLAFWLGRRLFGDAAGLFAAWWIALIPGGFLWLGHLGLADHHVLESWLAFAALALVCAGSEAEPRAAWFYTIAAGIALGGYLDTRPAGIFIPAIVIVAAILHPDRRLARCGLGMFVLAAIVFLPSNGLIWSQFTFLSLAGGVAAMLLVLLANVVWQRQGWPRGLMPPALAAAGLLVLGIAVLLRPALFDALWFEIRRITGFARQSGFVLTVQEMRPLLRSAGTAGSTVWGALFYHLGSAWILSLPALLGAAYWAWRVRRPSATLFLGVERHHDGGRVRPDAHGGLLRRGGGAAGRCSLRVAHESGGDRRTGGDHRSGRNSIRDIIHGECSSTGHAAQVPDQRCAGCADRRDQSAARHSGNGAEYGIPARIGIVRLRGCASTRQSQ